ncbi:uncharacterized protein [Leuresthes tenuis]|uniref:uncharacterized protein isoform X2 n=1 Tax=Leuresthes tenuis TaxID=355514 RepID=UPI003B50450A
MMLSSIRSGATEPETSQVVGNMLKTDTLRSIICEKLTIAAQDILAAVQMTVAEYEEEALVFRQEIERQRRHLELLHEIKVEATDDQQLFSLCEAGGGSVPAEEEQRSSEPRVEVSQSLGTSSNTEEQMEEEDDVEEAEQRVTEEARETTSRVLPPVDRPQTSDLWRRVVLRIRILEDSQIEVLSRKVYKKYRLHTVKCVPGLREPDFLNLLRTTFPQLAAGRPFEIFITDRTKKLRPLKVESLTPEQVSSAAGSSSLYIRLKNLEEVTASLEEPEQSSDAGAQDGALGSTPHPTKPNNRLKEHIFKEQTGPKAAASRLKAPVSLGSPEDEPPRTQLQEPNTHMDLKIRILEPVVETVTPRVYAKYPLQELKCPLDLQEPDFLNLLRSTYPQLAAGPFTILFDKGRKLRPLKLKSVTPEEILRKRSSCGSSVVYIRLQPRVKLQSSEEEPLQREDAAEDPTTPSTNLPSDGRKPDTPQSSEPDHFVDLRIRILEDPSIDALYPIVFQRYPLLELQCPVGLKEAEFLDLLRSTFPQLNHKAFDFLAGQGRKIKAMNVENLTPEEICRTIRSTGGSVLYIRLKEQGEVQARAMKRRPPFSDQTRPSASAKPPATPQTGAASLSPRVQSPGATGSLSERLRGIIHRALPAVSEATQRALVDKLLSSRLRSTKDLKFLRMEDVGDVLPAVQLRRLLRHFKTEAEVLPLDPEMLPNPAPAVCGAAAPPSSLSNAAFSSSDGPVRTETFRVPWHLMPVEIHTAVAGGKRPSAAERRQMVRVLVDEMRKYELKPKRSWYLNVCRDIVCRYPQSFADLHHDGQLLGDGCASLVNQVRNRIDSLNRNGRFSSPAHGLKRAANSFTSGVPPEDAAVEQKRRRMEEIYRQEGSGGAHGAEVEQLMEATFGLQRRRINAAPSVAELRAQWPYLFTPRGLYAHFARLTEVDVLRALELSMEECGRTIASFFISRPTNAGVRAVLPRLSHQELPLSVIQLLMAHFSEDLQGLVLSARASSTAADVERTLALPATPRLILLVSNEELGSLIRRWMISLEGSVICEGTRPTFLSGLAAVFSTYYTFNLQYEGAAVRTLEFIQRRFVGINPETDAEAGRRRLASRLSGKGSLRKTPPINPQVVTLLKKLSCSRRRKQGGSSCRRVHGASQRWRSQRSTVSAASARV